MNRTFRTALALLLMATAAACNRTTVDEEIGDKLNPSASPSPSPEPLKVSITSPPDGDVINGNTVELGLTYTGLDIVAANGDSSGKTGHFHVFIDRDPVAVGETIEKAPDIVHSTDSPILIMGLAPGEHRLTVVLGDGNHKRIGNTQDELKVTMAGPHIDASAPAEIAQGKTLTISVKTQGLTIVKTPEGEHPKSGHLHVFVDPPLPEYAKAIPADGKIIHSTSTSIEVKDLAVGEHVIYVVVGDGGHVPFRPLVADKITVKVV